MLHTYVTWYNNSVTMLQHDVTCSNVMLQHNVTFKMLQHSVI